MLDKAERDLREAAALFEIHRRWSARRHHAAQSGLRRCPAWRHTRCDRHVRLGGGVLCGAPRRAAWSRWRDRCEMLIAAGLAAEARTAAERAVAIAAHRAESGELAEARVRLAQAALGEGDKATVEAESTAAIGTFVRQRRLGLGGLRPLDPGPGQVAAAGRPGVLGAGGSDPGRPGGRRVHPDRRRWRPAHGPTGHPGGPSRPRSPGAEPNRCGPQRSDLAADAGMARACAAGTARRRPIGRAPSRPAGTEDGRRLSGHPGCHRTPGGCRTSGHRAGRTGAAQRGAGRSPLARAQLGRAFPRGAPARLRARPPTDRGAGP